MTLHNKSNLAVWYDAGAGEELLLADARVEIPLSSDGVLKLRLRLPYGSLSQRPRTTVRWIDRIIRHSSLFEDEWTFAIASEYVIGELRAFDTVEITRLVEPFGDGYRYDCLFVTANAGRLISENHEVPDASTAMRKIRKGVLRMFLLIFALHGGFFVLLGGCALTLWLRIPEPLWYGLALAALTFFLETLPDVRELRGRPRLSKALQSKAIIKHFRG